ncbi:MAG: SAM-dependent chlorinase/fluorinase [Sedimenticola sp.]
MASYPFTPRRIALFTDFGHQGPYLGQMKAVLEEAAVPVIDLQSDAPAFNARASAYLLAAIRRDMPRGTLYLSVVDPGVGGARVPLIVWSGGDCFVGPDNGLFSQVIDPDDAHADAITWQPGGLSDSFHGRDLFAPVASRVCRGEVVACHQLALNELVGNDWPGVLPEIIYVDHYGNLMTGLKAGGLEKSRALSVSDLRITYARTFCEAKPGELFWYVNSFGMVEIAANQARAGRLLGVDVGSPVAVID